MRRYLSRYLAALLLALMSSATSSPTWANELDSLLQQAKALGAPMAAVQRAIEISHQPMFPKKDALAVFDISQPSTKKRFTSLISRRARSPPTTRPMEDTMEQTQERPNSRASKRTWTWCRSARLRLLIPK